MRHGNFGLRCGLFSVAGGCACVFGFSVWLLFFFGLFLVLFPPIIVAEKHIGLHSLQILDLGWSLMRVDAAW
jgi:hypothetical protein